MPINESVTVDIRSAVKEKPNGMQNSEPHSAFVIKGIGNHPLGRKSPFSTKCLTVRPKDQSSFRGKFPRGLTIRRLRHQSEAIPSMSIMAALLGGDTLSGVVSMSLTFIPKIQVDFPLVVTPEGFPLAREVLAGNTSGSRHAEGGLKRP